MTRIKLIFVSLGFTLSLAVLLNSCKEVGSQVPWGNTHALSDTTYIESPVATPEARNVLIEMFTGVSCVNCPSAHVVLDGIIAGSAGKVIGIAMHSTKEPGSQDGLLPSSTQPLGCADAQTIIDFFGDPGARPVGSVDRIVHSATFTNSIYDISGDWSGYVQTEQQTANSPINLLLSNTYSASSRTMTIAAELHYTTAQTDSDKLSIFLTEDSIVSGQLDGSNTDTFYVHNLVMRAAVTNALGDNINAQLTAGTVVRKIYQYTITADHAIWKPEHMHIVAFVHKYQGGRSDVIQAKQIKVTP
jgi:hypothetical protein